MQAFGLGGSALGVAELSILYLRCELLRIRTPNSTLLPAFNSLFEMHMLRMRSTPGMWRTCSFNSLFEMPQTSSWSRSTRRCGRLSILYLRCYRIVADEVADVAVLPFNSLFEMHLWWRAKRRFRGQSLSLSILYLRCK